MQPNLFSLVLCVFGITTGEFVVAGILPDIADDLAVSVPAAGLLVTAYAVGMIVGGPLLTALTARFRRKPLLLALLAVAVAGNVASALAPLYGLLFVARVVTAFVTATFFATAIVAATSVQPPEKQGSTVAKLVLGMNLAMVLGAPLGTVVGTTYGWRATFAAIAAVCFTGLLLVARWVADVPGSRSPVATELRVFTDRRVQLAIAVTAVGNTGALMVFTYFAPLLTDIAGFAAGAVPVLLLVYGVGAIAGNLLGGRIADRALLSSQPAMLVLSVVTLLLTWVVGGITGAVAVLVFVLGAMAFAVVPGMQARILQTATGAPTLAIAVNASAYQLAAAAAGWLGGRTMDAAGLRHIYPVAAAVTAAGAVLSGMIWYRERGVPAVPGEVAVRG
ncbi:MFS transporter [Nocardia testacea]|uniref:MFS transporter n=1 Tax=Nocardia testacea TaxID=248551 RepID=UPI0033D01DA5